MKDAKLHLYIGDDDYPMGVAARELVNRLVPPASQAFGLEIIEGRADNADDAAEAIKRCREALVTPGFLMVAGKVVWWRSVSFLGDAQLAASEAVKAGMKDLASVIEEGHSGDATLVITAPGMDRRSAFYKLASSRFEVREFMLPEKAYQLEQHGRGTIARMLKEKGVTADDDAIELMVVRIGADSRQIAMETEKLVLYVGERRHVTIKDVQAVVSTTLTSVMWDLQDAVGERKLGEALTVLHDLLANKENARGIVASLAGRVRDLLLYREALDKGWLRVKGSGRYETAEWGGVPGEVEEAFSSVFKRDPRTLHPFVVGKMVKQARCYSAAALEANQRLLIEAYEDLVSSRVPDQTVLELTLVRMMAS